VAVLRRKACFSITARQFPPVRTGIDRIAEDAWDTDYTNAIWDEDSHPWISDAAVAEIAEVAFTSKAKTKQVTARLIVRRVPDVNPAHQSSLFTVYRYHAVFTNSPLSMLEAEKAHRAHAIVEQVIADLKHGPVAHLPSGSFAANSAWAVCAPMPTTSPAPPVSSPRRSTPKPPPAPSERS